MSKVKSIEFTLTNRINAIYPDHRQGKAYRQQITQYTKYLIENHKKRMTLEESKQYAKNYIDYLKKSGKADGTINTAVSAICKLYKNTDGMVVDRDSLEYKKHTLAPQKGRTVSIDKYGNEYYGSRPNTPESERLISFASKVGIRENEYKNLRKNDYVIRDNNYYVVVRRGKGGKYQEQYIHPNDVPFVASFFDDKSKDKIFSQSELKACEKSNLHAYRRYHAQDMYQYYASLTGKDREALVKLVEAQFRNGYEHDMKKYGIDKHHIMKKFAKVKNMLDIPYRTRGKDGKVYDRLSLIAISCLNLSHWRLDVTVQNYMR